MDRLPGRHRADARRARCRPPAPTSAAAASSSCSPTPTPTRSTTATSTTTTASTPRARAGSCGCSCELTHNPDSYMVLREDINDPSTETRIALPAGAQLLVDSERMCTRCGTRTRRRAALRLPHHLGGVRPDLEKDREHNSQPRLTARAGPEDRRRGRDPRPGAPRRPQPRSRLRPDDGHVRDATTNSDRGGLHTSPHSGRRAPAASVREDTPQVFTNPGMMGPPRSDPRTAAPWRPTPRTATPSSRRSARTHVVLEPHGAGEPTRRSGAASRGRLSPSGETRFAPLASGLRRRRVRRLLEPHTPKTDGRRLDREPDRDRAHADRARQEPGATWPLPHHRAAAQPVRRVPLPTCTATTTTASTPRAPAGSSGGFFNLTDDKDSMMVCAR